MNAKKEIKIVKREERYGGSSSSRNQSSEAAQAKDAEAAPNATRKVARQVGAWVREFQQRQLRESGQSFASLFQRA
jgi:hypothetical protein